MPIAPERVEKQRLGPIWAHTIRYCLPICRTAPSGLRNDIRLSKARTYLTFDFTEQHI